MVPEPESRVMPSTKPRINVWIPERLKQFFGKRAALATYVEPSTAPTPDLRKAEEKARIAHAKLRQKELLAHVERLSEDAKALILANGGDVTKLDGKIAELEQAITRHVPVADILEPSATWASKASHRRGAAFIDYLRVHEMRRQAAERAELVTLRPVALKTEPSPAYTFTGLFEHWRGGENDKPETWRIKGPRHTASTARLLEKCFPARDYRSIDVKDAIYFADWLHEKGIGPASQMNHLSSARAMYKAAWKLMHDKPNPFEKVKAVADHTSAARGKFTYAQLRNILRVAATPGANGYRWADNRVEKRHDEALWMLRLAIYTGARISEIAALQVADLKTYDDGKVTFPYLYFRPEIVKAQKDEDKSRETPLHPDIAAEFVAFVKSVKGPNIFAGFGGKANWIVSNFPAFLRDNAEALGIKLADGKPVEHNKGRPLCQHCLRHTLHKAMNDSRINPIAQRVFVGRKGKDVHDSVYATDMGLAELYKDVCQMKPLG